MRYLSLSTSLFVNHFWRWAHPWRQFLQTLDEILFTNVDVSAGVLGTLFTHLSISPSLQTTLRGEIQHWKRQPDFDLAKYMAKSDTLLNRTVMESMRHSPAFGTSLAVHYE